MDTGTQPMPKPLSITLPETQVTPLPELEKRNRLRFTTEYKLRILAEAGRCRYGELGELLRRENLYSNQIQRWRRQLAQAGAVNFPDRDGPALSDYGRNVCIKIAITDITTDDGEPVWVGYYCYGRGLRKGWEPSCEELGDRDPGVKNDGKTISFSTGSVDFEFNNDGTGTVFGRKGNYPATLR